MSYFVEGAYDGYEFSVPKNGMNQNISPETLPPNFAYILENIIPTPKGRGMVRYGTSLINNSLAPDSTIIEYFPFIKSDGNTQLGVYAQEFTEDLSVSAISITSSNVFNFTSNNPSNFEKDTPIKITYRGDFGTATIYSNIYSINIAGNVVTITLQENSFPQDIAGLTITHLYYTEGNIYFYDFSTSTLSGILAGNLSIGVVPRYITFQNTLLICNGVDPIMSWDGTTLQPVIDMVKETASNFNWIDATHFSFQCQANFIIQKYQNNNTINVSINGNITTTTVSNVSVVNNIVTVTTNNNIPRFTGQNVVALFYADQPPPFNFMFVAHDRIWALGTGAVGLEYRSPDQAMLVYYANQPNSVTKWFNEQTKLVPTIDLSDKHGVPDNLEAICQINSYIAFVGRQKTQVWQGTNPTPNANPLNKFIWAHNFPIGIAHGNLLQELANDIYLITSNGMISLSTYNVAKQLAATSADAVDPLIRQYIENINQSNVDYRACRSFKYKSGPFCGFKIGNNKLLVSLYSTNLYSWSIFSGDFQNAQTFCSDLDNSLYLAINNKIYQYSDGNGSPIGYGDQGGTAIIPYFWTLPVIHENGRRFANKRYEIRVDYPSSFNINYKNNVITIGVVGDISKTFFLESNYEIFFKGDPFNTIPLVQNSPDPNVPERNILGMRFDKPYQFIKGRLKFVSSSFWLSVSGYVLNGPLYFDKVRLFGIFERKS